MQNIQYALICLLIMGGTLWGQGWMEGRVVFKWKNPHALPVQVSYEVRQLLPFLPSLYVHKVFPHHEYNPTEDPRKVDLSCIYELHYDEKVPIEAVVKRFYQSGNVVYAEPRFIYQPFYDPNDPDTAQQYWINRIEARLGWNLSQGDTNVKIAIIDNGIQWNHPDLVGNVAYNWTDPINGLDDDNNGYVDDFHGWDLVGLGTNGVFMPDNDPNATVSSLHHGTSVTGYAAASTDNGVGIAGVGFKCRFFPIKAAGEDYGSAIIAGYEGIVFAADQGCAVINCSWGGNYFSYLGQDVVNYATYNKNALVIAAAGNSNSTQKFYPAAYPSVMAVGATNSSDLKGSISSYGRHIDVMAPGTSKTTAFQDTYTNLAENYTSFASPIVAGVAALVKSQNPSFTAEQIRQKVRVTADDIDALNPSYIGMLGKGRVNLFKALNISSPAVRYQNFSLIDGNNNLPQNGDSIRITVVFKNFLSPTTNLTATLSTNDPYITVLVPTRTLGAIPTLGVKTNTLPFIIKIAPNAPNNYSTYLRIDYSDGSYTDFEYYEFVINPTFQNITTNFVQTSITDDGNLGFADYPNNALGIGWIYNGLQMLFEGGILIGRKPSGKLSDNIRTGSFGASQDFLNSSALVVVSPGLAAEQEAYTAFNDNGNTQPLNYSTNQKSWAFATEKYIITQLTIRNNNFTIQDSVYAGVFADFDIGNALNNRSQYDTTRKIAYTYSADAGYPQYVGIVHLTDSFYTTHCYVKDAYAGNFTFNKANKLVAISSGTDSSSAGLAGSGTDTYQFISAGPMTLLPLDSVVFAYAVVSGDNLNELFLNAQKARFKYRCIVQGSSLALDLGPDVVSCGVATLDATTPGAVSYFWSTNQTTPQIQVNASGTYTAIAFDAAGCFKSDEIQVTIVPPLSPDVYLSNDTLTVQDTLFFADSTSGTTSWNWNFGNGFGSFSRSGFYQYPDTGTYTLTLFLSNGVCSDTLTYTIVVQQPTTYKLNAENTSIHIFPNPAKDFVYISAEKPLGKLPVQLFDIQGKELLSMTWDCHQPLALPVNHLAKGIYLLRIQNLHYKLAVE